MEDIKIKVTKEAQILDRQHCSRQCPQLVEAVPYCLAQRCELRRKGSWLMRSHGCKLAEIKQC